MTDTTKGDISATTALTATGNNDTQTQGQSRDVVVYGSEQQLGITLALWRLDEKLEVIKSQIPEFADIIGKKDDDFEGYVAIFEDVPPGTYQLEVDGLGKRLSRVTVKSRSEKSPYREVDISTVNIPKPEKIMQLTGVRQEIANLYIELGGEYNRYTHDYQSIRNRLNSILQMLNESMRQ